MKPEIRDRLLRLVAVDGRQVAARAAAEMGITRQAVSRYLARLSARGLVVVEGVGRGVRYRLAELRRVAESYPRDGLEEDRVWRSLCLPVVADLGENVRQIWQYGITEMVNNAIDHSGSPVVRVAMSQTALHTAAAVADEGEGIFLKLQRALGLPDPREAILELAKGKLTTDPAQHTGEGIFFASKLFDGFDIRSGRLHFAHDAGQLDVLMERSEDAPGTLVLMSLTNDSPRVMRAVFDEFAAPDEYTFAKTVVPVRLAQYEGETLMSRSQAKRLTARFERFHLVVLDFSGVREIGQSFADEVFRVFQQAHPRTALIPIQTTPEIEALVTRARAGSADHGGAAGPGSGQHAQGC